MSRKNVLTPHPIFTSASMATSLSSEPTNAQYQDNIGLHVKWTSSDAVGVIAVEGSVNWDPVLQTGDFVALTFTPALAQPSSNNGSYLININQFPYTYYRVTYARTSGSGTLSITVTSKAV